MIADQPGSQDFDYVRTDIPAGMTIRVARSARRQSSGAEPAATARRQPGARARVDRPDVARRGARPHPAEDGMTPSTSQTRDRTRRTLGAGVAVMVIAALCVSVVEGTPRPLPGLALGSLVLLHAERTLALVGVVIAALSVLAQGRSRPPPG